MVQAAMVFPVWFCFCNDLSGFERVHSAAVPVSFCVSKDSQLPERGERQIYCLPNESQYATMVCFRAASEEGKSVSPYHKEGAGEGKYSIGALPESCCECNGPGTNPQ